MSGTTPTITHDNVVINDEINNDDVLKVTNGFGNAIIIDTLPFNKSGPVIVSVWAKTDSTNDSFPVRLEAFGSAVTDTVASTWQRIVLYVDNPEVTEDTFCVKICPFSNYAVYLYKLQVEIDATKVSDWKAAPEDMEESMSEAQVSIAAIENNMGMWFDFTEEGLYIRKGQKNPQTGKWEYVDNTFYTKTSSSGYYVMHTSKSNPIIQVAEDREITPILEIGNGGSESGDELICKKSYIGGWKWTDA